MGQSVQTVAVRAENDSSDFSGKLGFTLKIGNREKNPPRKEADLSALSHNERCRKMAKKQFKAESKKLLDMMINSIYTNKERPGAKAMQLCTGVFLSAYLSNDGLVI